MNAMKAIITGIGAAMLLMGVPLSHADSDDKAKHAREHEEIRAAMQRGEVLPLSRILEIAQQQVPGDVIEVELESKRGALIYEIKVLTESGRVREVKIDARNGTVLEIEDD